MQSFFSQTCAVASPKEGGTQGTNRVRTTGGAGAHTGEAEAERQNKTAMRAVGRSAWAERAVRASDVVEIGAAEIETCTSSAGRSTKTRRRRGATAAATPAPCHVKQSVSEAACRAERHARWAQPGRSSFRSSDRQTRLPLYLMSSSVKSCLPLKMSSACSAV